MTTVFLRCSGACTGRDEHRISSFPLSLASAFPPHHCQRRRQTHLRVGEQPRPNLHYLEGFMKSSCSVYQPNQETNHLEFCTKSAYTEIQGIFIMFSWTICRRDSTNPFYRPHRRFSCILSRDLPMWFEHQPFTALSIQKRNCQKDYSTLPSSRESRLGNSRERE